MQSKLSKPAWLMGAMSSAFTGLMHADSWRLTWKIWYHLHLIFIFHLWWLQNRLTAGGNKWGEVWEGQCGPSLWLSEGGGPHVKALGFIRRPHLGSAYCGTIKKMKSRKVIFIFPCRTGADCLAGVSSQVSIWLGHGRYAWIRISTHEAAKNDCVQEKRFGLLNTGIYLILSVRADRLMLPGFSQMNPCD